MTKLLAVLCAALLVLSTGGASVASPAAEPSRGEEPSREVWLEDVSKAMRGSGAYLRERVATGDTGLAVNFDIDNSSVASYYDGSEAGAIPRIMKFARQATKRGVVLLFNSGRRNDQRARTLTQLAAAGYDVTMLCLRKQGEAIVHGKQRCRDKFIARGYTLVANVGNNPTDFTGDGYEAAYRLPNYSGALG